MWVYNEIMRMLRRFLWNDVGALLAFVVIMSLYGFLTGDWWYALLAIVFFPIFVFVMLKIIHWQR